MSELRECPFCGGARVQRVSSYSGRKTYMFCMRCRAQGPIQNVADLVRHDAESAWNTRPASRVEVAARKFLRCVEEYHDAIKLRDDLENRHLWSAELRRMYDAMGTLRAALAPEGENA